MINENLQNKTEENRRALTAKQSNEAKNDFLSAEQDHILHLTARILMKTVSMSDDEWSIALVAVGEAIDSYDETRGNFWNYAALVIKSRINDYYRKNHRTDAEILTGPEAFVSDPDDDSQVGLQIEVRDKTAVVVDTGLRDELDAFDEELGALGISLFELPAQAPKASKTRLACARLIEAFFEPPPPIVDELKSSGNLPVKELIARTGIARKLIDKHRKYLIAGALIKDGEYPQMAEYLPTEKA